MIIVIITIIITIVILTQEKFKIQYFRANMKVIVKLTSNTMKWKYYDLHE